MRIGEEFVRNTERAMAIEIAALIAVVILISMTAVGTTQYGLH